MVCSGLSPPPPPQGEGASEPSREATGVSNKEGEGGAAAQRIGWPFFFPGWVGGYKATRLFLWSPARTHQRGSRPEKKGGRVGGGGTWAVSPPSPFPSRPSDRGKHCTCSQRRKSCGTARGSRLGGEGGGGSDGKAQPRLEADRRGADGKARRPPPPARFRATLEKLPPLQSPTRPPNGLGGWVAESLARRQALSAAIRWFWQPARGEAGGCRGTSHGGAPSAWTRVSAFAWAPRFQKPAQSFPMGGGRESQRRFCVCGGSV